MESNKRTFHWKIKLCANTFRNYCKYNNKYNRVPIAFVDTAGRKRNNDER